MTATKEAYERFKHLDHLLSDTQWIDDASPIHHCLYELWKAIKIDLKVEEGKI